MRKLLLIPVFLGLLWVGYWFIGALVLDRALTGWIDARGREGWVANYDDVAVTGFPLRFETVVRDVELADPATGVAWTAPDFRFTAKSARPNEITAIWPAQQTVATPLERIEITSDRMQGRIGFAPNTALELRSSDIGLETIALTSTLGWSASLESGVLRTSRSDEAADAHDILFEASGLRLAETVRGRLDPARMLSERIDGLRLQAWVDFDAPWDRFAIEEGRPQITAIRIDHMRATWGQLDLRAAGAVTVAPDGTPEGEVIVKATNWSEMLAVAEAAGAIPPSVRSGLERGLGFLARLSGPSETLDVPLTFRGGLVTLGPIPLGPAPRIVLR
ncbi:DUF2125 domain-containing protein [Palleronia sp. KMU-117]|uniref:DUF2125 domain-containing protein n=1 Tax=Palleronia sp. KMU-117 TaxID=3434108 RepID=UPI003D764143